MNKRNLYQLLAVMLLSVSLLSCKKNDTNANTNTVSDPNGVTMSMQWSLTTGNAATDADLDLYLMQGTGSTKTATQYYSDDINVSQENFTMPSTLPDGDYTLTVDFVDVSSNGTMTFGFQPTSGGTAYHVNNVSFTTAADGTTKDVIKITKSGTKFTITQL